MHAEYNAAPISANRRLYILQRLQQFSVNIGYAIDDSKYFRKLGPPLNSFAQPVRGSEIFITGLPSDSLEDEIYLFFVQVGRIFDIRLMVKPLGLYNRGYAFLRYFNPEDAKNAITILNHSYFRTNVKVTVQKSIENNRLYMCGVPFSKTKIEIWDELVKNEIKGITDVFMYKSHKSHQANRGFIFVEFVNHDVAASTRYKYLYEHLHLFKKKIVIDWASSTMEYDSEVMRKVTRLFVRNLPLKMTRAELTTNILRTILNDMTAVEKVYKTKDFAFIHFINRETAEVAMQALQRYFRGGDVEVTWSVPPEEVKKVGKTFGQQQKVRKNLQSLYLADEEMNKRRSSLQFQDVFSSLYLADEAMAKRRSSFKFQDVSSGSRVDHSKCINSNSSCLYSPPITEDPFVFSESANYSPPVNDARIIKKGYPPADPIGDLFVFNEINFDKPLFDTKFVLACSSKSAPTIQQPLIWSAADCAERPVEPRFDLAASSASASTIKNQFVFNESNSVSNSELPDSVKKSQPRCSWWDLLDFMKCY